MSDDARQPAPDSATIEVLAPPAAVRRSDLRFTFVRAAGPGGQAVNKLSTAALLRVAVTAITGLDAAAADRLRRLAGRRLTADDEILIRSRAHRSQIDNRRACVERLRGLVRQALVRPVRRRKKKPTRAMIERRLTAKRQQAEKKRRRRGDE